MLMLTAITTNVYGVLFVLGTVLKAVHILSGFVYTTGDLCYHSHVYKPTLIYFLLLVRGQNSPNPQNPQAMITCIPLPVTFSFPLPLGTLLFRRATSAPPPPSCCTLGTMATKAFPLIPSLANPLAPVREPAT